MFLCMFDLLVPVLLCRHFPGAATVLEFIRQHKVTGREIKAVGVEFDKFSKTKGLKFMSVKGTVRIMSLYQNAAIKETFTS